MKKCPWCAESIQDDAIVCRFCQRDVGPAAAGATAPGGATPDGTAEAAARRRKRAIGILQLFLGAGVGVVILIGLIGMLAAGTVSSSRARSSASDASGAPAAAPARAASGLEVTSITTRITESNDSWARFAWRLTVKNHTLFPARFRAEIEWQDAEGFVVDTDREYGLVVEANSEHTFTGNALITYPGASRVTQVAAKIVPR